MGQVWGNVGVVAIFILIGAFFAAAEIALVSLRESQMERLSARGRRGRILATLASQPNRYLAAVQVGVTLAGFVSAGFGAAQIAPALAERLVAWGWSDGLASTVSFIVVTILIAYVSLVIGELVPKRLALQRAESIALIVAAPVEAVARLARPFIWLLSVSTDAVVRLLGGDPSTGREQITEGELRDMVAAHEDLTPDERAMIDDIFDAGDRRLREVMVPRTEVAFIEGTMPIAPAVDTVVAAPHSRYPVIASSSDDVVGFVHIRDILAPTAAQATCVEQLARPVLFLPGSRQVIPALSQMRQEGHHLAIVVDEYGGTAGIVTLEDLVEELIGDIRDEYDVEEAISPSHVDGLLNLDEFAEITGVRLPDGPYETAAGYVVAALGRLPSVGDRVTSDGSVLTVSELDGRRISRLTVRPEPMTDAVPALEQ